MSELQFEKADYENAPETQDGPLRCTGCPAEIDGDFWEINGGAVCAPCLARLTAPPPGTPGSRFWAALGWGSGAAVLGFLLYYAVYWLTGWEIGLVAIVVGVGVGMGVRKGAHGVGGAGYQILAIALTYLSICATYYVVLLGELASLGHEMDGFTYVVAIPLALALPFLAGIENLIGLLIIGFGLYEAWKFNKRPPKLVVDGPFWLDEEPATDAT